MLSAAQTEALLAELCVTYGFCLAPDERQHLQADAPADADSFTVAVFRAEGLDPDTADRTLYRKVHAAVTAAFR